MPAVARIVPLSLLAVCLTVVPVAAQDDLYDNGPTNGTVSAWTVDFGFAVSDSFTLSRSSQIDGLMFAFWLSPTLTVIQADVQITSSEFGGTTYFDGAVNFTQASCVVNQLGYNLCTETGAISPLNLNAGTYWLTVENATASAPDDIVYWDENSGPSLASENSVGTIPSESFTLLGSVNSTTTTTGTSPEPSSIVMFGSGMIAVAGILRRKFF